MPVIDIANYSEIDEVALSPTGEYLAMAVPKRKGKETKLQIINLADDSTVKMLRFGQESRTRDID